MKRILFVTLMFGMAVLLSVGEASSTVYVRIAPPAPRVVKVVAPKPYPNAVFVSGYWAWNSGAGKYIWIDGHWVKPPRGKIWVEGQWVKKPRGYVWVPGHWRAR